MSTERGSSFRRATAACLATMSRLTWAAAASLATPAVGVLPASRAADTLASAGAGVEIAALARATLRTTQAERRIAPYEDKPPLYGSFKSRDACTRRDAQNANEPPPPPNRSGTRVTHQDGFHDKR